MAENRPSKQINKKAEMWHEAIRLGYDTTGYRQFSRYWYDKFLFQKQDEEQKRKPVYYGEIVDQTNFLKRMVVSPVVDILGDNRITRDNVKSFLDATESTLNNIYNQIRVRSPRIQIAAVSDEKNMTISTPFSDDIRNVFEDFSDKMYGYAESYDYIYGNFMADKVEIRYFLDTADVIRGASRSMQIANEKWVIIDTETRTNCAFVAVYIAMKWKMNPKLLIDPDLRITNSRKFKERLALHIDEVTAIDFQQISESINYEIHVYNNIFEKEYVFTPSSASDHPLISIRVANCHAQALIPKSELAASGFDLRGLDTDYMSTLRLKAKIAAESKAKAREKAKLKYIAKTKAKLELAKQGSPAEIPKVLTEEEELAQAMQPHKKKIPYIFGKHKSKIFNSKYVSWDLETYTKELRTNSNSYKPQKGSNKSLVVYASGLAYHRDFDSAKEVITHQIFTDKNNLTDFIGYIGANIETFKNCTFYAHNGGKFDLPLLIRDAIQTNPEVSICGRKFIELNGSIIGFSLAFKGGVIHFRDSFKLFASSLASLTSEMNVAHKKLEMDHTLITKETFTKNKESILLYHKHDLLGLLEVMDIVADIAFKEFGVNIVDCFTAASLSKKIKFVHYWDKASWNLIRIPDNIASYIRSGYKGGRCECFQLGEIAGPIYYYDFTSLYPSVGCYPLPTGVSEMVTFSTDYDETPQVINKVYGSYKLGFIRCNVIGTEEMLKGIRPLHGVVYEGKLVFPYLAEPTEIILSIPEIRKGLTLGYKYALLDGCVFQTTGRVMEWFFRSVFAKKYQARQDKTPALELFWKVVLNSGYGFWGLDIMNKNTISISRSTSNAYLGYLMDNKLINVKTCGKYNIIRHLSTAECKDVHVGIAAMISSYARIKIHELITDVEAHGGKIYMCDTDSLLTNFDISGNPTLNQKYRYEYNRETRKYNFTKGAHLGGLKNELGLDENNRDKFGKSATIVGCKMYTFEASDRVIDKLKGYKKDKNVHDAIQNMNDGQVVTQTQTHIMFNKNDMMRDGNSFEIRVGEDEKHFKKIYTKGIVTTVGTTQIITPLVL
jgi:hypothetical protein